LSQPGRAPDVDTLVGGFVPAALIILKDLAAGMSFQQAATDAQAKTGVTVTFLNDPGLTEYALILALIAIIAISALTFVQPGLSDQACAIRSNLEAGLGAAGLSANSPDHA
jgi:Flp pilus assembly pilin Flp